MSREYSEVHVAARAACLLYLTVWSAHVPSSLAHIRKSPFFPQDLLHDPGAKRNRARVKGSGTGQARQVRKGKRQTAPVVLYIFRDSKKVICCTHPFRPVCTRLKLSSALLFLFSSPFPCTMLVAFSYFPRPGTCGWAGSPDMLRFASSEHIYPLLLWRYLLWRCLPFRSRRGVERHVSCAPFSKPT